jgi:poly [ADP-ribose] polymerase
MQLLFNNESKTYHVWHFQYQPGSSNAQGQPNVSSPGHLASAKDDFLSKFKSFTGLSWDARCSDPLPGSWISLEMSHRDVPIITSEIVKLPEQVEKVLNIIFESSQVERYVAALNNQGRGVSVQYKLDRKKLQIGFAILKKQIKLCASDSLEAKKLARIYQKLILGPNGSPLHDLRDVRKELESLELLLKLQYASEILKSSGSSSMALSQISQVLGLAKMEPGKSFCTSP